MTEASAPLNADQAEVDKFAALAHRWWDTQGEFATLHQINPLRLGWIESQAALRGARVLDVGCGGGILAEAMARRGADVLGIDLAEKSLKVAKLHALQANLPNVRYECVPVEALAQRMPQSFDVVTCMEMLEHVPDAASVVAACAALAKPGGVVCFSTIHRSAKAFLQAIVAAEYVLRMLPRGTHEFARLIRPHELAAHCRAAGLAPSTAAGLGYNPWTGRFCTSADTSVNYMLAARKPA